MNIYDVLRKIVEARQWSAYEQIETIEVIEECRRLPGKTALAAEYGVATTTIERAMKVLAEQGYVQPVRSAGTYVVNLKPTAVVAEPDELAEIRARLDRIEKHLGIP